MTEEKIKLGVLWKNVSREGKTPYLSGRVQRDNLDAAVRLLQVGGRFLVLSNKKRPDRQDPDCDLFVVPEPERREDRPGSAPAPARPTPAGAEPAAHERGDAQRPLTATSG